MRLNRTTLLFLALAAVAALAVFAPPRQETVGPVTRSDSAAAATARKEKAGNNAAANSAAALGDYTERGILGKPRADLFGTQSWQPPPPKVVVAPPPPPPAPQPPALMYRFAGRFLQDGKSQVYVSKGDTPVAVKVGDNLDGYIVESIGAGVIALLYEPLGHRHSIPIPPDITVAGAVQGAASVAAVAPAAPQPAVGAARVKWDGPAQIRMGANFSVSLRAEGNQPISGSALQVRFDPALLASVSVKPGKVYAGEKDGFSQRVNADGSIFVGANRKTAAPPGDTELLILTFKPLKPGARVEVSLASLNMLGPGGRTVLHDTPASYRATVAR